MRAKGPLRVLVLLLVVSLLPALTVRATHEPQSKEVIAAAESLFMECFADPGQERCLGSSRPGPRDAYIIPQTGPLQEVTTDVTVLQGRTGWTMDVDDQSFNTTLHVVGCADLKAVAGCGGGKRGRVVPLLLVHISACAGVERVAGVLRRHRSGGIGA